MTLTMTSCDMHSNSVTLIVIVCVLTITLYPHNDVLRHNDYVHLTMTLCVPSR